MYASSSLPRLPLLTLSPRYNESNASFAALARQTTELSQRDSVLYDNDELPSMRVSRARQPQTQHQPREGIQFTPLDDVTMGNYRTQLGLTDWSNIESS